MYPVNQQTVFAVSYRSERRVLGTKEATPTVESFAAQVVLGRGVMGTIMYGGVIFLAN